MNSKRIQKSTRKTYEPFERKAESMCQVIAKMTPRERRKLRDAMMRLNRTNCSWIIYGLRPLLYSMLSMSGTNVRRAVEIMRKDGVQ